MSRIYDNQPLRSVPLTNVPWSGEWNPKMYQIGNGVIFEATIQGRSRYQVTDKKKLKSRHYVFHVKVNRAHKRQYDGSGKEIEPNFSETMKVSTGYLPSSYKVTAKGQTDRLTEDEATKLLTNKGLDGISSSGCPAGCLSVWIEESAIEGLEFVLGDKVRIKTKGDSPFIENITRLDVESSTVSNYGGGEQVGATWTDKIMAVKHSEGSGSCLPQDQVEGVDEDEWDD